MTHGNGNGARRVGTVVFYWDYDTQWGGDRSRSAGGPKAWGHAEFEQTDRLLELHAAAGIPACFAVVGRAALRGERPYHDPAQVHRIALAGHEVGSHGFEHEWVPGLGRRRLREVLRASKEALEQCSRTPVVSFVPPFNQPFDYARGWSFSWSERREAGPDRIDLERLCDALAETGYQSCRVAYRPLHLRVADRLLGRTWDRPRQPQRIGPVTCFRLNTPCGFGPGTKAIVDRSATEGGVVVIYGHPHSLQTGGAQDERWLAPLLEHVRALRDAGRVRVALPRDLLATGKA